MTARSAGPTGHRRRFTIAVLTLLVAVACAACAGFPAPRSDPPSATAMVPTPDGADFTPTREPAPNSQGCDETASLRPGPLPVPGKMPPRTAMADIFHRGRLIVGTDIGSNLFSFRDPITGDIEGFDVDLAREVARAIFGDPNRIEFRVLSSADRIQALHDHTVDIVVKTMSITCDRLVDVDFSAPYYMASQRILAFRNSGITGPDGLVGKRVCAARGTTSIGRMQSIEPRAHMVTTTTWADCLVMLQQSQVDAATTDDAVLAGLAEQDPWFSVVGPNLGAEYYGVGIAKGADDLTRFVNGVLEQIKASGRWQQLYNQWLTILGPGYGPPQSSYRD